MIPYLALSWSVEGTHDGVFLGESVASAGDVNGDGYSDIVTGGSGFTNGESFEGGAFVYLGSGTGLGLTPAWSAESNLEAAFFGATSASAGDVDGDGFGDLVVGAPGTTDGEDAEGRVYLYHGSAAGLELVARWTVDSNVVDARLGSGVASAGDVNGDGYDDVVICNAPFETVSITTGMASLYLGSSAGLEAQPVWSVPFDHGMGILSASAGSAGDVNGDGFDDVVVGASGYTNGEVGEGGAFVYLGSPSGPSATPDWSAESDQAGAMYGRSVASAGDVNGDGYDDLVVGAPLYENGQMAEGGVWLYLGSAAGLESSAVWSAESNVSDSEFGWSVSSAGDVNADGFADIVVGAWRHDDAPNDEGWAFVFLGTAAGPEPAPTWWGQSDDGSAWYGYAVASAGDVNDDGFDDVIVGAPVYDDGAAFARGKVYVYDGAATFDTDLDGIYDHLDQCSGDDGSGDQDLDGWCAHDAYGAVVDCGDSDATVYPGAPEQCDDLDTACVGSIPADEMDVDADGVSLCAGDCDDDDPTSFPGAVELCDGVDNVCAGSLPAVELDEDDDGVLVCADDCDDTDPTTWPGAPELCDGIVNGCVGELPVDERDGDGDGVMSCDGDCNDADVWANPALDEVCDDNIDNNCDGTADEGCQVEELPVEEPAPSETTPAEGCGCTTPPNAGAWPLAVCWMLLRVRRRSG